MGHAALIYGRFRSMILMFFRRKEYVITVDSRLGKDQVQQAIRDRLGLPPARLVFGPRCVPRRGTRQADCAPGSGSDDLVVPESRRGCPRHCPGRGRWRARSPGTTACAAPATP